jgi:hypothetical protein
MAGGSHLPIPMEKGDTSETFQTLATQFRLNEETMAYIKERKIETLNDLRFFFAGESEVAAFLAKKTEIPDVDLMTSRVRAAWHAIRQQALLRETDKSKVDTADLDDMLDDAQLNDAKQSFWRRYKTRYPPEAMPADSLVSRCSREMSKRMLMVYNVNGVKNLMHQITSSKKRKKLGTDLFTEQEEAIDDSLDASQYLDRLHTYLLALALAGAGALTSTEAVSDTSIGAVTTLSVHVPLDIIMAYFWRAKRTSQAIPVVTRLKWLERQDVAERTQWVAAFRDSEETLGTVIRQTMSLRDAHWATSEMAIEEDRRQPPSVREQPGKDSKGPKKPKGRQEPSTQLAIYEPKPPGSREETIAGHKCCLKMKDNTELCKAFQLAQCKGKGKGKCPSGKHQCAVLTNGTGRVCGMGNHGASEHR